MADNLEKKRHWVAEAGRQSARWIMSHEGTVSDYTPRLDELAGRTLDWLKPGTPEPGDTWADSIATNLNKEKTAALWSVQVGQFKVKELSHAAFGE